MSFENTGLPIIFAVSGFIVFCLIVCCSCYHYRKRNINRTYVAMPNDQPQNQWSNHNNFSNTFDHNRYQPPVYPYAQPQPYINNNQNFSYDWHRHQTQQAFNSKNITSDATNAYYQNNYSSNQGYNNTFSNQNTAGYANNF